MGIPALTLLLTVTSVHALECQNGADSTTQCDANEDYVRPNVCTERASGLYEIWACDLSVPADTNAGTIYFYNDSSDNHMEAWGTAGNGEPFCCEQDGGETIELRVFGTSNNDTLYIHDGTAAREFQCEHPSGQTCVQNIHGLEGDDLIETSTESSPDTPFNVYGGDGDDTLTCRDDGASTSTSNCKLYGGDDDDTLNGSGAGDAVLSGGAGADTIYGNSGGDLLLGGADGDYLYGGADNDTIKGEGGADEMCGGGGADTLEGGPGDDKACGGDDGDVVKGNVGSDDLFGGSGTDTCDGGAPSDYDECGCETNAVCDDTGLSSCPITCP